MSQVNLSSLDFVNKAGAYLGKAKAAGAPVQGRLLALITNIRIGGKALPGTNTLAY